MRASAMTELWESASEQMAVSSGTGERLALQARWLALTREALPALAAVRRWPVAADHCFQRILLDNACSGRWYDHVAGRPAYAHADRGLLERAVALGEAVAAGAVDLAALNARSLGWRRAAAANPPASGPPPSRQGRSR